VNLQEAGVARREDVVVVGFERERAGHAARHVHHHERRAQPATVYTISMAYSSPGWSWR